METEKDHDSRGGNGNKAMGELEKVWKAYRYLLKTKPLLTKSISSAVIAALGDILAQTIVLRGSSSPMLWRQTGAFTILGLCYSGPLAHYFYSWLDQAIPKNAPHFAVKRIIADRFVIAPPYLLGFFYLLGILEGVGHAASVEKIRSFFWIALKLNWKMWTILQFINLNYVPIQYRVLFQSCISFIWTVCLAAQRRSSVQ